MSAMRNHLIYPYSFFASVFYRNIGRELYLQEEKKQPRFLWGWAIAKEYIYKTIKAEKHFTCKNYLIQNF